MAHFYLETIEVTQEPSETASAGPLPAGLRKIAWLTAAVVLLSAGITAGVGFFQRLDTNRNSEITGHCGSKKRAPENTLSALQRAITEMDNMLSYSKKIALMLRNLIVGLEAPRPAEF